MDIYAIIIIMSIIIAPHMVHILFTADKECDNSAT